MLNMDNNTEESPKRRSTFYVSLDGTSSIGASSISPKVILTRTLSNNESITSSRKHEDSLPESHKGKVQSLTRIFESGKGSSNERSNNRVIGNEDRKKVERTRSFKTIERFQNRFTGRKDSARKENRLNNTIACFELEEDDGKRKKKNKNEESNESVADENNRMISVVNNVVNVKCCNNGGSDGTTVGIGSNSATNGNISKLEEKKQQSSGNTTLTNLLIRRTHSTKLARSGSSLLRSANRHASVDSSSIVAVAAAASVAAEKRPVAERAKDRDREVTADPSADNSDCIESSLFEDVPDIDGGMHSDLSCAKDSSLNG
uniref:Uncharacterized protein n=1 Tax=Vespula pensylvanica TaxID=30213 RepID=A0A834NXW3_VESPE|nr:hypothetical protein H0235_010924 [Vespula pensylvanica]